MLTTQLHSGTWWTRMFCAQIIFGYLLFFAPRNVKAQLNAEAVCRTCAVELVRHTVIPTELAGIVVQSTPSIAYTNGAFVLAPTYGGSAAIFRSNTFIAVGKKGGGPREFPGPRPTAVGPVDGGAYIVHSNRLSLIDIEGQRVKYGVTLPWAPAAVTEVGSNIIAAAAGSSQVSAFDLTGKLLWKRGTPAKLGVGEVMRLSPSGDTAYWVTSLYTYAAHLIRMDGTILRTVRRNPKWFVGAGFVNGAPLQAPPSPSIYGVRDLGNGLMMFLIDVADSEWAPGPKGGLPLDKMRPDEYLDTILEIVDIDSSKLITSARYDQSMHFVSGSPFIWTLKEVGDSDPTFEIFEPKLRR